MKPLSGRRRWLAMTRAARTMNFSASSTYLEPKRKQMSHYSTFTSLSISNLRCLLQQMKYENVENRLASLGLRIVTMENDGNCLFSAVALQVLGSAAEHATMRAMAISHMVLSLCLLSRQCDLILSKLFPLC